jgi:hypothetical protein
VVEVIGDDYPSIQHLVSIDKGDYVQPVISLGRKLEPGTMVLTFDNFLKNTKFVPLMRTILRKLEQAYQTPVDIEYALEVMPDYPYPEVKVHILQCRPLSEYVFMEPVNYPEEVTEADIVFTTQKWTPSGQVADIKYVVYVNPEAYACLSDRSTKVNVGRAISRINEALAEERFILLGPGRWGSSNIDLGVRVTYADIYNTAILGEIAIPCGDETPEVSYGTHFFQDLVEAKIYPLPLYPGTEYSTFNDRFFEKAKNSLADVSPQDADLADYVKVIDVSLATGGKVLEVVMDGENERAIGYLKAPK